MLSMTGCGRGRAAADGREMTVEIKTVNHRFLDISLHVPRHLSFTEDTLRRALAKALCRGHVDLTVNYQNTRSDAREVHLDVALAKAYQSAVEQLCAAVGADDDMEASHYAALPDVFTVTERDEDNEAVLALLQQALTPALDELVAMRKREGASLREDLLFHLGKLEQIKDEIALLAPQVPVMYRKKLEARLAEVSTTPVDPQRLAQEVLLFADKCAIDEELSRLTSHIAQMRAAADAQEEVGRKLDFLTQELNREVNTIGSKATDVEITNRVVAAKGEIEKLREQVQNVE